MVDEVKIDCDTIHILFENEQFFVVDDDSSTGSKSSSNNPKRGEAPRGKQKK
jgi:hypothetical protein